MNRLYSLLLLFFSLLFLCTSCIYETKIPKDAVPEDFVYVRRADSGDTWAILLPGSSGLPVFGDDRHYFRAADSLNAHGISVILVDYKAYYKTAKRDAKESTAEKILWVTEKIIKQGREDLFSDSAEVNLVAWSLGAEVIIALAENPQKINDLQINSAALFYPSVRDEKQITTDLPLLILTGAADNITPAEEIESVYRHNTATRIEIYPEAHHGFDVASLSNKNEKDFRLPPLVGRQFTFKYNAAAEQAAIRELTAFLRSDN